MKYGALRFGKPLILLAVIAVSGWMVMLLWNAVMPAILTNLHPIDYWHAVGLLILCRILFGGFRDGGRSHRRRHWRRWEAMTREERNQFKRSFETLSGAGSR
jgi:hypothetical protein